MVTGGEPIVHPCCDELLEALAARRREVKPMQIVLRTNLARSLEPELAESLLLAADEVVVSVDGDQVSHDAQRGAGAYNRTVENLRMLHQMCSSLNNDFNRSNGNAAKITIAATLTPPRMEGSEGDAVRALAEQLDMPARFKPVLPLGRGANLELKPAFYSSLDEDDEALTRGAQPAATCGLGMNLYVGPDGACYPCYALMASRHFLGNAIEEGLLRVLSRNDAYRQVTVDSNLRCRTCALRYLCGGYCRAWSASNDPDAPLPDCTALCQRAERILQTALTVLEVNKEDWQAAELPLSVK